MWNKTVIYNVTLPTSFTKDELHECSSFPDGSGSWMWNKTLIIQLICDVPFPTSSTKEECCKNDTKSSNLPYWTGSFIKNSSPSDFQVFSQPIHSIFTSAVKHLFPCVLIDTFSPQTWLKSKIHREYFESEIPRKRSRSVLFIHYQLIFHHLAIFRAAQNRPAFATLAGCRLNDSRARFRKLTCSLDGYHRKRPRLFSNLTNGRNPFSSFLCTISFIYISAFRLRPSSTPYCFVHLSSSHSTLSLFERFPLA